VIDSFPLISVIIPVYKVEPYLRRCIDSVLEQTYSNLEILLVDDGSPDNCPQICDEYVLLDSRVRVIHKENGGVSSARNVGLDCCKGEFISFVDSDDFVAKTFIEELLSGVQSCDADISIVSFKPFKQEDEISNRADLKKINFQQVSLDALLECCSSIVTFTSMRTNASWNKLYKRSLFENVRFPEGRLYEDLGTTFKLLFDSARIVSSKKQLYFYRLRDDSIIGNRPFSIKYMDLLKSIHEAMDWLSSHGRPDLAKQFIPPALMSGIYSWWGLKCVIGDLEKAKQVLKNTRGLAKNVVVTPYFNRKQKMIFLILLQFPFLYVLYRKIAPGMIGNRH